MNIEKNVCMNILGTLLDISGKSKDDLNVRQDLVHLKIRPELAPINGEKKYLFLMLVILLQRKKNIVF